MRKIKITITTDNAKYELNDEIPNNTKADNYVSTLIKKYTESDDLICFIINDNDKGYKATLINKTKINTIEITEVE